MDLEDKRYFFNMFKTNEPNHCPVVVMDDWGHESYHLLHREQLFSSFIVFFRRTRRLSAESGYFFLVGGNTLVTGDKRIGELYDTYKDQDEFLHLYVLKENIFG